MGPDLIEGRALRTFQRRVSEWLRRHGPPKEVFFAQVHTIGECILTDWTNADVLDVTDRAAVRSVVERAFARLGRVDVVVSNAGYGLFGAAEELSDKQIDDIVATNLVGSIQLIRAVLPHLRKQGGGRIIQMSTYGGQVAFPGNCQIAACPFCLGIPTRPSSVGCKSVNRSCNTSAGR